MERVLRGLGWSSAVEDCCGWRMASGAYGSGGPSDVDEGEDVEKRAVSCRLGLQGYCACSACLCSREVVGIELSWIFNVVTAE